MTKQQKAEILMTSAIEFLAAKHGVTAVAIVKALSENNAKVCDQFAELVTEGVMAAA